MECTILEEDLVVDNLVEEDLEHWWILYVDGSSNTNESGVGLILVNPEGDVIQYVLHFRFSSTNNEAEYEALITGLRISKKLGVQHLKTYRDSQLTISHVPNEYKARE